MKGHKVMMEDFLDIVYSIDYSHFHFGYIFFYPTAPSNETCSSFCASTANSIGSLSITSFA